MNCLAFRFSAMGDVALTIPVIRSVLVQNPDIYITLVSNNSFEPLFQDLPRFKFYGVDFKNYPGVFGIFRLFRELDNYQKWDCVLDLHSVIRTWILSAFFKLKITPTFSIDKGRYEKKLLTQKKNKKINHLLHTTERYKQVFNQAGISCKLYYKNAIHISKNINFEFNPKKIWIGIAPFSKHIQKELPTAKIVDLLKTLSKSDKFEILIFGGGNKERKRIENLNLTLKNVHSVVNKFNLSEELSLIKKLKIMITMDSFNMHLSALIGIKVISIWGPTHSFAGFGPVNENNDYKVEIPVDQLSCRPCSVFGNTPCYRGDLACMNHITVKMIVEKINCALE